MNSGRFLRLAGVAAGGLTVAGAAVAITATAAGVPFSALAASPTPKPSATARPAASAACDAFIGHLAKDLGKSTSDVQAAARKAAGETIDDQVKAGKLTADQAAKIKAKLAASDACAGVGGIGGFGPKGHDGAPGRGPAQHLAADVAAALGTTEADLQAQLKSGKTLKDLAAAKGMDEAAFRAAYLKAVKADLDQQVAAGKLTAQQETDMLAKLQTAPIPFWNGAMHPRPAASPAATN